MAGVNANFQFGLLATTGTLAQSKSYAYDEAQYQHTQNLPLAIGAQSTAWTAGTSTVTVPASQQQAFCSPHAKQLKSITAVPVIGTAVLAAGGDYFQLYLVSMYAQVFGTATGPSYFVGSNTSGTFYGSATNTGTNVNVVQIFNVMTFMTGQAGSVRGTGSLVSTAAPTPQTVQIAGGTFTIVVANGVATTTQGGYVFPVGPNGGLSLNPGDVLIVAKGTDTVLTYVGELELTFTPGGLVTR